MIELTNPILDDEALNYFLTEHINHTLVLFMEQLAYEYHPDGVDGIGSTDRNFSAQIESLLPTRINKEQAAYHFKELYGILKSEEVYNLSLVQNHLLRRIIENERDFRIMHGLSLTEPIPNKEEIRAYYKKNLIDMMQACYIDADRKLHIDHDALNGQVEEFIEELENIESYKDLCTRSVQILRKPPR